MIKRYINALVQTINFPVRVIKIRSRIGKIDKKAPFDGELHDNGVFHTNLSKACINDLERIFLREKSQARSSVYLQKSDMRCVGIIFNTLEPIVRSYVGEECYLDGINWMVTKPKEASISGNWHLRMALTVTPLMSEANSFRSMRIRTSSSTM